MNNKCFITGANGYVGSALVNYLEKSGFEVIELSRKPSSSKRKNIFFSLDRDFKKEEFSNCDVLIHCAYDFSAIKWEDIKKQNVDSSIRFLQLAKESGVKKIIFISSISAFENSSSLYGKAKYEVEKFVSSINGVSIRPALVYGESSGGMVGNLRNSIKNSSVVPVVGAGQKMFLSHEEDLAKLIIKIVRENIEVDSPITAASSEGWLFIDILKKLAVDLNKSPKFILLPWRFVWLGIKTAEIIGMKLNFRSDSLISLMNPNPNPNFSIVEKLGVSFRKFGQ